jgi:hypothetical protein
MGISLLCNAVECGSYVPSRHFLFSKEELKGPDTVESPDSGIVGLAFISIDCYCFTVLYIFNFLSSFLINLHALGG